MMGRASDIQIEQNIHKEGLVPLVKLFWYLRDFSIIIGWGPDCILSVIFKDQFEELLRFWLPPDPPFFTISERFFGVLNG